MSNTLLLSSVTRNLKYPGKQVLTFEVNKGSQDSKFVNLMGVTLVMSPEDASAFSLGEYYSLGLVKTEAPEVQASQAPAGRP